jgi:hypothetical protein
MNTITKDDPLELKDFYSWLNQDEQNVFRTDPYPPIVFVSKSDYSWLQKILNDNNEEKLYACGFEIRKTNYDTKG